MLRRSPERPRQIREITIPGAVLDSANRMLTFEDGKTATLTAREFELLSYMAPIPTGSSPGTSCSAACGTWTRG